MASGIYTAMSGAVAQSQALDVTANNIANADTTGFQAERMSFSEALSKTPSMIHTGIAGAAPDGRMGVMRDTGNPLDCAIDGPNAYFAIDTSRGPRYTRDGSFRLSDDGTLVTSEGLPVRAQGGGKLSIPDGTTELHIEGDGALVADGAIVGQIQVSRFAPTSLKREGQNMFSATGPGLAGDVPQINSGTLEGGNFEVVRGVIDLVRISRTYEALHRMVETYKQLDERTARDIGGGK